MKQKKQTWNIGDVYAYKINSEEAKEYGLIGRYFLVQKICDTHFSPRVLAPIVYVKITKDDKLPTTTAEFDQLEFVQTFFTNYEDRFNPIDFSRLEEDIAEKSKMTYTVDEYGYLPHFRARLILAVGKTVPPDVVFVGSFPDAARPKIEFIPHCEFNIRMIFCKKNSAALDRILSRTYYSYNLKTLEMYKNKTPQAPRTIGPTDESGIDAIPEWMRKRAKDFKDLLASTEDGKIGDGL